jgi:ADP-ribosylglycohydrolase
VKITWIEPVQLVEYELRQIEEEGRDATGLRRQWAELTSAAGPPATLRQDAFGFLDSLTTIAGLPAGTIDEPSTLDGILAACGKPAVALAPPPAQLLTDRITGGWFGRAAGCLLGKPVEKFHREGIRKILSSNGSWPLSYYITEKGIPQEMLARFPWNRHAGKESLRENILCMTEDDDMNYPMLNLSVLETAGRTFATEHIAEAWLENLPVLSTFTAERVAYLNCLEGVLPPATALRRNPYREWIGAQIRGDVFGWVSPGDPHAAAGLAFRDARLSHVRNGIYGELFVAAMIAAACVLTDTRAVIESGLRLVPPHSRFAAAVRFALSLPSSEPTWEGAVDRLYEQFGRYHWVHTINNISLVVAALMYGNGDFERSICNVVMGGWDTDSNGATVGSVVGTMLGARGLPERWTKPLNNKIRSSLKGFDNAAIDDLARRTAAIALTPHQGHDNDALKSRTTEEQRPLF